MRWMMQQLLTLAQRVDLFAAQSQARNTSCALVQGALRRRMGCGR